MEQGFFPLRPQHLKKKKKKKTIPATLRKLWLGIEGCSAQNFFQQGPFTGDFSPAKGGLRSELNTENFA